MATQAGPGRPVSGGATPKRVALASVITGHILLGFVWLVVFLSVIFLTFTETRLIELVLLLGGLGWVAGLALIRIGWRSGARLYWAVPIAWVLVFSIAGFLAMAEAVSSAGDHGPPRPGTACPKNLPPAQGGRPQGADPPRGAALIAFDSDRDGNRQIYVMNADGTDQRRLTRNATTDMSPAWSPDGTRIAFMRRCWHSDDETDADKEIFVMNADGTGQRNLTRSPRWEDEAPRWSPDGTKIIFASTLGLAVMNADGKRQHVLDYSSGGYGFAAPWSPDGKRIAFVRAPGQHYAIYVMKSDGSGETRVTDARVESYDPAWSPDGKKIAFTRGLGENPEIYLMSPDGSGQRRLTHGGGESAAWSPEGTKIAFESDRDGHHAIYVMNADGSGATRLTQDSAEDPAWRPAP
jgi:dipeptidyl aminopeptidase/acylaminoacyl peptidase